ncbi:unnamed protein product [Heterosigma akashiwo]
MLERPLAALLALARQLKGVGFDSELKRPAGSGASPAYVDTVNQYLNQLFQEEGAAKNQELRTFIGLDWLDGTRGGRWGAGPTSAGEVLGESQRLLLQALKAAVKGNRIGKEEADKVKLMIRSGKTSKISEAARMIQETVAKCFI